MPRPSYRDTEYAVVISGAGRKQTAIRVPLADSALDYMMPLTQRQGAELQEAVTEQRDCTGEFIIGNRIDSRFSRMPFNFDARTKPLAIFLAYAMGAAAVAGATPANEVQTVTINASGGTFTVTFTHEGVSVTTRAIAWNATAGEMAAALNEALAPAFEALAVAVGVSGQVYTVTFQNGLGSTNLPLLTTTATALIGGTQSATVAGVTNGANREHLLALAPGYQLPYFSASMGFRNSTVPPRKYYDAVVTSIDVTGQTSGVTVAVNSNGNGQTPRASAYTYPVCDDTFGIRFADCRVKIGADFYAEDCRGFRFQIQTGSEIDDDAFTMASIDVQRAERASERTAPRVEIDLLGEEGDALYEQAKARTILPVSLILGKPSERVVINLPNAELSLQAAGLGFDGAKRRSTIKLVATGLKVGATLPINVAAYFPQATALLLT